LAGEEASLPLSRALKRCKTGDIMYNSYAHWKNNIEIDESKTGGDSFSGELSFGTSGIRGIMGIGPNRINEYVIARACKGFAMQLTEDGAGSVALTYDSRINSQKYARICAEVFAANGIKAHITQQLAPTPLLAYAVRRLGVGGGVAVTASHNPKEYNGFKVYGRDGSQISGGYAEAVSARIKALDYFGIKKADFERELQEKNVLYFPQSVYLNYIKEVKKQGFESCDGIKVCYTPLNGSGGLFVPSLLSEKGAEVVNVAGQLYPDGEFPTCPYPNPEFKEAFTLAETVARQHNADIIIANDPDADRIGAMYYDGGRFEFLSGDEIGLILCAYLMRQKSKHKNLKGKVIVRSAVTLRLVDKIAKSYGVEVKESLTGFKNICAEAVRLNSLGRGDDFIAGYEESNGFMAGSYVYDKDGICAAMLLCEAAAHLKRQGKSFGDFLNEIYREYGILKSKQIRINISSRQQINLIMDRFRSVKNFTLKVINIKDYAFDENMKQNLLIFEFEGENVLAVRPSGTEPYIKIYMHAAGENYNDNFEKMERFVGEVTQ
jgi:phosphomannomutase